MSNSFNQEVQFSNNDQATLAGLLSIAKGTQPIPAVVLIAGYGPYDRNGDRKGMGKKPFKVIADYLVQRGVAVLRYDKRGIGQSTGVYETATTQDLANDVKAAVSFLASCKEIDGNAIGLIGLSEGGRIAAMVAAELPEVAYAVLLAPAILSDPEHLIESTSLQMKADGASDEFLAKDAALRKQMFAVIQNEKNVAKAAEQLQAIVACYVAEQTESDKQEAAQLLFACTQEKAAMIVHTFNGPWYRGFIEHKPLEDVQKLTKPVLALFGDRDWIVWPGRAIPLLEESFKASGHSDYTIRKLTGVNHAFQRSVTGSIKEYAELEEPISPQVLDIIGDWIVEKTM